MSPYNSENRKIEMLLSATTHNRDLKNGLQRYVCNFTQSFNPLTLIFIVNSKLLNELVPNWILYCINLDFAIFLRKSFNNTVFLCIRIEMQCLISTSRFTTLLLYNVTLNCNALFIITQGHSFDINGLFLLDFNLTSILYA